MHENISNLIRKPDFPSYQNNKNADHAVCISLQLIVGYPDGVWSKQYALFVACLDGTCNYL